MTTDGPVTGSEMPDEGNAGKAVRGALPHTSRAQPTCKPRSQVAIHKAILMTLLAVVSSSAAAEWVAVGGNDVSNTYVDPATILKVGDNVKMWHLVDFNTLKVKPSGKRYLSEKLQFEYDCKEERARMLTFLSHSGNMGGGVMVEGDWHPQKWAPLPPGGLVDYLRKFACGKR